MWFGLKTNIKTTRSLSVFLVPSLQIQFTWNNFTYVSAKVSHQRSKMDASLAVISQMPSDNTLCDSDVKGN